MQNNPTLFSGKNKYGVIVLCTVIFAFTTVCIYISPFYSTRYVEYSYLSTPFYIILGVWLGILCLPFVFKVFKKPLRPTIDTLFNKARARHFLLVLGLVMAVLSIKYLNIFYNKPVTGIDNGSMVYRLRHVLFRWPGDNYDPFFNCGFSTYDWVLSCGILNVFFLFFPLLKLLDLTNAYNIILLSTHLLVPILFYHAAYQVRFNRIDAAIAAVFATISTRRVLDIINYGLIPWIISVLFSIQLIPIFFRLDNSSRNSPISWAYVAFATLLVVFHGFSAFLMFPIFFFVVPRIIGGGSHRKKYIVYCIATTGLYLLLHGEHSSTQIKSVFSSFQKELARQVKETGKNAAGNAGEINMAAKLNKHDSSAWVRFGKDFLFFSGQYFLTKIFIEIYPPLLILGIIGIWGMLRIKSMRLLGAAYLAGSWLFFLLLVSPNYLKSVLFYQTFRFNNPLYLMMVIPAAMTAADVLKILSGPGLSGIPRLIGRYFVVALAVITPFYFAHQLLSYPAVGGQQFRDWLRDNTEPAGRIFIEAYSEDDAWTPGLMYSQPPALTFLIGRDIVSSPFITPHSGKSWLRRFTETDPSSPDYIVPALAIKYLLIQSDFFKDFVEGKLDLKMIGRFKKYLLYDTGVDTSLTFTPGAEVHYDINRILLTSPSTTTRLKFMWHPGLQVSPPTVIKPYEIPGGLTIIELQGPPNQEITIRYPSFTANR